MSDNNSEHSLAHLTMAQSIDFINPSGLYDPSANAYSHITSCKGVGRLSYIAGQGGETVDGELADSFSVQVEQALDNLHCALRAIQASFTDIAKLTVLIVEHDQPKLAIWSQALRQRLAGAPAPACTLIPVARLALDKMLIEIDATVWQSHAC